MIKGTGDTCGAQPYGKSSSLSLQEIPSMFSFNGERKGEAALGTQRPWHRLQETGNNSEGVCRKKSGDVSGREGQKGPGWLGHRSHKA